MSDILVLVSPDEITLVLLTISIAGFRRKAPPESMLVTVHEQLLVELEISEWHVRVMLLLHGIV